MNVTAIRASRLCRGVILLWAILLPAAAAGAPVKLPAYTRTKLANGLTVYVMPTRRLPLVDFRLVVDAGAARDPAGKEGLASLTADLLTQGAGRRNARQIAEDIAFVGGTLEAAAGSEQTVVTCEVLKRDLTLGLELVRDVVVSPTFPDEDFKRRKDETLGAIASALDDPGSVADRSLPPFVMGRHPLGHPAIGWKASVESVTRADVVAFHHERFTPGRAILAVVGDVDAKLAIQAVQKAFAGWRGSEAAREALPPLQRATSRRVLIVSKPEVTQTQIRMACAAVPRKHPDYYPIVVANTILGSGFTSRLMNEIRVVQGLTYSIRSRFSLYRDTGLFGVNTFTRNETLRKCIDETLKVIQGLVENGPAPDELAKAKRYLTGQFPLGLQAPDELAAQLLDIEFYGLDSKFVETYSDRIDAVTMEDARRVLKSHFCVNDLQILVVSKPELAKTVLRGLGPIEVGPPQ